MRVGMSLAATNDNIEDAGAEDAKDVVIFSAGVTYIFPIEGEHAKRCVCPRTARAITNGTRQSSETRQRGW
jgi:hypothetical protein